MNIMLEKHVGDVIHYFGELSVAVVELTDRLSLGDKIRCVSPEKKKGMMTNFLQIVTSIQVEHIPITQAVSGQLIAIKVDQKVRTGDKIYKVD